MKTPEEIKKGLECCYSPVEALFRCVGCPYQGSAVCKMSLHNDALEYIARLEAKNEAYKQSAINCCYESRCNKKIKDLESLCQKLTDEKERLEVEMRDCEDRFDSLVAVNERIERERKAAVEDLKMLAKCPTCAHYDTPCGRGPCMNCHPIERQGYVWRGVKEEEKNEH